MNFRLWAFSNCCMLLVNTAFYPLYVKTQIGNMSTCMFFSSYSWLWNARVILMYYVRWTQIVFQHQCSICFLPFNWRSIVDINNQLHDSKWKPFIHLRRLKPPSWLEVFSLGTGACHLSLLFWLLCPFTQ